MEIIGLKRLNQRLRRLLDQVAGSPSVVVGYGTNYAIYVHENLKARHVVGEAKFLERPARELSDSGELSDLVKQDLRLGRTLEQALLRAGLRIQRESQKRVPVDTGTLRASATTRKL